MPRVVVISYHGDTQSYTAGSSPPAILGINRESRHEGLNIYKELDLGAKPGYKSVPVPKPITGAYIKYKDRVYLSRFWGDGVWCKEDRDRHIRKICEVLACSSSGFGVGFQVFRNLVTRDELWELLRPFYSKNFRTMEYRIGMCRVVPVHEEGDGCLPRDIKLVTPGRHIYKPIGTLKGRRKQGEKGMYTTPRVLVMEHEEMATVKERKRQVVEMVRLSAYDTMEVLWRVGMARSFDLIF
jgi:hypothetical protein